MCCKLSVQNFTHHFQNQKTQFEKNNINERNWCMYLIEIYFLTVNNYKRLKLLTECMMPLFKDLKRKISEVKEEDTSRFLCVYFTFCCFSITVPKLNSYANYSLLLFHSCSDGSALSPVPSQFKCRNFCHSIFFHVKLRALMIVN